MLRRPVEFTKWVVRRKRLGRARRYREAIGLLYLDLDGFKQANDSMGHDAGDRLLKEVADRLVSIVRSGDTAARLGGDEFVFLLVSKVSRHGASVVARKVLDELSRPYPLPASVSVTASIGAALYPMDGEDVAYRERRRGHVPGKATGGQYLRVLQRKPS